MVNKRLTDIVWAIAMLAVVIVIAIFKGSAEYIFFTVILVQSLLLLGLLVAELRGDKLYRPPAYITVVRVLHALFLIGGGVVLLRVRDFNTLLLASLILLPFVWVQPDYVFLIRYRLRHAMRWGNMKAAGEAAKILYRRVVIDIILKEKKASRRKYIQSARNMRLLGSFRESVGDYYIASMFYSWALGNYTIAAPRRSGGYLLFDKSMILTLCSAIRVLHFFKEERALEYLTVLNAIIEDVRHPALFANCIAVGAKPPTFFLAMASHNRKSLTDIVLKNLSSASPGLLSGSVLVEKCLLLRGLAEKYYHENRDGLAINEIEAILHVTNDNKDIRVFFVFIDAIILKRKIMYRKNVSDPELSLIDQVLERAREYLVKGQRLGNEYVLFRLSEKISALIRVYISSAVLRHSTEKHLIRHLFELMQMYKGISNEIKLGMLKAFGDLKSEADKEYLGRTSNIRKRMGELWADSDSKLDYKYLIEVIELQDIENYLIGKNQIDYKAIEQPKILLSDVAAALLPGERFLQIIRSPFGQNDVYIGFYIDYDSELEIVPMGKADEIDHSILYWRSIISKRGDPSSDNKSVSIIQQSLIDPLLKNTVKIERLLISVEDQVSLIPFEAFYNTDEKKRLLERFEIIYIDSAKDILKRNGEKKTPAGRPVVFASPDFEFDGLQEELQKKNEPPCYFGTPFEPLGQAQEEGRFISKLLQASYYEARDATVPNLRQVHSPVVLHLATHAFSNPELFKSGKLRNIAEYPEPMGRCGLAFAGINAVNAGRKIATDVIEDGILNGNEVLSLDIRDTKLVVLSACETGLGEMHSGEGILGLRSAFKVAGAETVITSLWKAEDQATNLLMQEFYRNLLDGITVAEALRRAKIKVYTMGNSSPYYWALFTCFGLGIEKIELL
ncbi:MAG: CHAT domain-containing protein [Chitinophagaceae bacterium]